VLTRPLSSARSPSNAADGEARKYNYFAKPIKARLVRFYPTDWVNEPTMRADVLVMAPQVEAQ
jgi:hypothetical protein